METKRKQASAYLITCVTDLHAGSGDNNFGVIDNLVQRDSNTNLPTINASSLKGALREYFCYLWNTKTDKSNQKKINYIFGPDGAREGDQNNQKSEPGIGHYKFFPADLLVLPVRSSENIAYYRATSPFLKKEIERKAAFFGLKLNLPIYPVKSDEECPKIKGSREVWLEDFKATNDSTICDSDPILGDNIAWFPDDKLKHLANSLPVISRNQLDNGISKNLWYEEVVPRESRFVFFVLEEERYSDEFLTELENNEPIQIGGNASIGRGYITIKKIS